MKKVVCFTESLGGGGAEHQIVILSSMLAERNYDVSLVTYASLLDHYDTPDGVKRLDIGKTCVTGRRLKALVKFFKIFHFFLWARTDCVIAYRQCANLRVLPPLFFRNRRKVKVICSDRNLSTRLSFRHKLLLYCLYNRANYIVPNSKAETEFIAKHRPSITPKLCTIHNYTDLNQFVKSSIPSDLSVIKIAIFSRYSNQKNPIGFANAIKRLKENTSQSFEVHWYGIQKNSDGSLNDEYLTIKKKVDEDNLSDFLKLLPAVKDPSVLMNSYHAVCLPSLYEGFSNSIAEGICSAKPMIVSDVSDNSIMVHDRENGFLFDPRKVDSIVEAFSKFFSLSYEEMCKMGMHSRLIAEELFDKEAFIEKYIALIES